MTEPGAPEGWYSDPDGRVNYRYWSGSAWTTRVRNYGGPFERPIYTEHPPPAGRPAEYGSVAQARAQAVAVLGDPAHVSSSAASREGLESLAFVCQCVGVVLALIAIVVAFLSAVIFGPENVVSHGFGVSYETDIVGSIRIGASVLLGSAVVTAPYFLISYVMKRIAALIPDAQPH